MDNHVNMNTDNNPKHPSNSNLSNMMQVDQYIFREIEFEGHDFDAAEFVAKYRRVTSLESLRQQLQACSEGLKQQLYVIINRDYKDFINIATKLDGVDTRIEFLRKPLVDLRLDLAALHDGLVASLQSIQDKLERKAEVSSRRLLLETILACTEKLDIVENIVHEAREGAGSSSHINDHHSSNMNSRKTSSRRQLLRHVSNQSPAMKEAFICSELERASYAIKHVDELLEKITHHHNNNNVMKPSSSSSSSSMNMNRMKELEGIQRALRARSQQLLTALVGEIQKHVSSMLPTDKLSSSSFTSSSSMTSSPSTSSSMTSSASSFAHLIRSCLILDKGSIISSCIEQVVVSPIIRSIITQGRVDGSGGRGSYMGLHDALSEVMLQLKMLLSSIIIIIEQQVDIHHISSSLSSSLDVMLYGVWQPVSSLLMERFSSMFTIAIPDNFARCYIAYDTFRQSLPTIILHHHHHDHKHHHNHDDDKHDDDDRVWMMHKIQERLESSDMMMTMDSRWRMDVYYHLRCQEIYHDIDHLCEIIYTSGITKDVSTPSSSSSSSSTISLCKASYIDVSSYHLSCISSFAIHVARCFDEMMMLRPLRSRFLQLALQLLQRYEAQICLMADISSSSSAAASCRFNKAALSSLQAQMLHITSSSPTPSSSSIIDNDRSSASSSPPPKISGTPATAITPPMSAHNSSNFLSSSSTVTPSSSMTSSSSMLSSSSLAAMPLSTDDMVLLAVDISTFCYWMKHHLISYIIKQLSSTSSPSSSSVEMILSPQIIILSSLSMMIWHKACHTVAGDCKRNLGGVRVIAGKYRMTNKPPPDAPSAYVETILQPLRLFRDQHNGKLSSLWRNDDATSSSSSSSSSQHQWMIIILEDIASYFSQQISSLMETVKQMDSALQRRSKANQRSSSSSSMMSDSEKIALQVSLDVNAFIHDVVVMMSSYDDLNDDVSSCVSSLPAFKALLLVVAEESKLVASTS